MVPSGDQGCGHKAWRGAGGGTRSGLFREQPRKEMVLGKRGPFPYVRVGTSDHFLDAAALARKDSRFLENLGGFSREESVPECWLLIAFYLPGLAYVWEEQEGAKPRLGAPPSECQEGGLLFASILSGVPASSEGGPAWWAVLYP